MITALCVHSTAAIRASVKHVLASTASDMLTDRLVILIQRMLIDHASEHLTAYADSVAEILDRHTATRKDLTK